MFQSGNPLVSHGFKNTSESVDLHEINHENLEEKESSNPLVPDELKATTESVFLDVIDHENREDKEKVKEHQTLTIGICKGLTINISRPFIPVKLALFCCSAGGGCVSSFLPVFLKSQGFTITHLSIFTASSVLFQFLGSVSSGIISDKIGRVKPILLAYLTVSLLINVIFSLIPSAKECATEITRFKCCEETMYHFITTTSCNVFENGTHTISCSLSNETNSNIRDDTQYCSTFLSNLSTNWIMNIEQNRLQKAADLHNYETNFENYSVDIHPSCVTEYCKLLEMDCISADNTNCYIKTEFRT
ncbi:MFS_1_like domain-containing protein, partial [Nephila pilipes]